MSDVISRFFSYMCTLPLITGSQSSTNGHLLISKGKCIIITTLLYNVKHARIVLLANCIIFHLRHSAKKKKASNDQKCSTIRRVFKFHRLMPTPTHLLIHSIDNILLRKKRNCYFTQSIHLHLEDFITSFP